MTQKLAMQSMNLVRCICTLRAVAIEAQYLLTTIAYMYLTRATESILSAIHRCGQQVWATKCTICDNCWTYIYIYQNDSKLYICLLILMDQLVYKSPKSVLPLENFLSR